MSWLDGITDSMHELWEMGAWRPVVHGAAKSPTWLSNRATTTNKGRDAFSGWTPEYYNMLILPQLDFLIPQLSSVQF